jgi:hypothetical protein
MGPSGGLKLDGDLLANISRWPLTGLNVASIANGIVTAESWQFARLDCVPRRNQ